MAALVDRDPRLLSTQQRKGLRLLDSGVKLYRNRGRWGQPLQGVSLDVAASLRGLGLVSVNCDHATPRLVLTGAGQAICAVMSQRRRA